MKTIPVTGLFLIIPHLPHPTEEKKDDWKHHYQEEKKITRRLLLVKTNEKEKGCQHKKNHTEEERSPFSYQIAQCCYTVLSVLFMLVDLGQWIQRTYQKSSRSALVTTALGRPILLPPHNRSEEKLQRPGK